MKLTIEHLAAYLPYGISAEMMDFMNDYVGKEYDKIVGVHQWDKSGMLWCALTEGGSKPSLDRIKPLLRSLSDLTKEIEHNGERFVPIEKLFLPEINISVKDVIIIGNSVVFKGMFQDKVLSTLDFNNMNYKYVTKLLSWHFNIFKLPETLYIKYSDIE